MKHGRGFCGNPCNHTRRHSMSNLILRRNLMRRASTSNGGTTTPEPENTNMGWGPATELPTKFADDAGDRLAYEAWRDADQDFATRGREQTLFLNIDLDTSNRNVLIDASTQVNGVNIFPRYTPEVGSRFLRVYVVFRFSGTYVGDQDTVPTTGTIWNLLVQSNNILANNMYESRGIRGDRINFAAIGEFPNAGGGNNANNSGQVNPTLTPAQHQIATTIPTGYEINNLCAFFAIRERTD